MHSFPTLLSPLDAGRLQLRNRFVFPAHQTMFSEGGEIGARMRGYYGERARGGVGAIVVEGAGVHPTTRKFPEYLMANEDIIVPGLRELARLVHGYGTKVLLQILHSGSRMPSYDSGLALWAPSDVRSAISAEVPHAMTLDEIAEVQDGFAAAARNVRRAGADGVEIHSAHEYLPGQFLSPFNNRRTDRYGGSLENRCRFLLEVIDRVRAAIGDDLVVGVRMNGSDLTEDGVRPEEYLAIARAVAATGKVDYLSVSAGTSRTNHLIVPPMDIAQGVYVEYAAAIKAQVPIPVFTVGRIKRPEHAEALLAAGKADAVAMARALIADPHLPAKLADGDETVRPCIGCNECFGRLYRQRPITCLVNPAAGRETELGDPVPPITPRRVTVIGGGPAGLEAARVAAGRGHHVTVLESSDQLGGQLAPAAAVESRTEFGELGTYLRAELDRLRVDVRLGCAVRPEAIAALDTDVVIVATGSRPRPLPVSGSGAWLAPAVAISRAPQFSGKRVAVVDDAAHFVSYAPAEALAAAGAEVILVTARASIGAALDEATLATLLQRLARAGVHFATSTSVTGWDGARLLLRDGLTGRDRAESVDAVVCGFAGVSDDALAGPARAAGFETYVIGDSVAARTALEAIREGNRVARSI